MPKQISGLIILLVFQFSFSVVYAQKNPKAKDYRQEMRELIKDIAKSARSNHPGFIIITQNGIELILKEKNKYARATAYLNAITGVAQEDLFYGYNEDNVPTPPNENSYLLDYLKVIKDHKKPVLSIDYAFSDQNVDNSYLQNVKYGFTSFVANRSLDEIPERTIFRENSRDIKELKDARNFLYLLNFSNFESKDDLIEKLADTNYDLLIIDAYYNKFESFTSEEISQLGTKKNGGSRLVIAYMSIGEAEEYRYYWQKKWNSIKPAWLSEENPHWKGNYKVKFWHKDWKKIVYTGENSYLNRIIAAGFDGVYLDIIDAFEYFESE